MSNGKSSVRENTEIERNRIHESIVFATPFYEKKGTMRAVSYGMVLITDERMILVPISSDCIVRSGEQEISRDRAPGKPVTSRSSPRPGDPSRLESLELRTGGYLGRDADEIMREENGARAIRFEGIDRIVITRVRTDSRSSRWLTLLFALYPLEPAVARYRVDYHLAITTPEREYTFVTPFSLSLKQVLVDRLGDRVHEIVDEFAPLL